MVNSNLCILIPDELKKYLNLASKMEPVNINIGNVFNFGIKIINKADGQIDHIASYSQEGELEKRIFYEGSVLAHILYYKNELLNMQEDFFEGKVAKRIVFNRYGNIAYQLTYTYDRKERITSIQKTSNGHSYRIEYGYDELERVNSRKIIINNHLMNEQLYRYDIMDKIVMYKDNNQTITVKEVGVKNELVSYVIQDKLLNNISVYNKFFKDEYDVSEVTLNGHKMLIKNKCYVDNVMLRRPYTREDDLNFMMSNLLQQDVLPIKRTDNSDSTEHRRNINMHIPILPISIRKRALLNYRCGF